MAKFARRKRAIHVDGLLSTGAVRDIKAVMKANLSADAVQFQRGLFGFRLDQTASALKYHRADRKALGARLAYCKAKHQINSAMSAVNDDIQGAGVIVDPIDLLGNLFPTIAFYACHDCNNIGRSGYAQRRDDGEPLCQSCADESYYYNPDSGRYQDNEYHSAPDLIGEYHSSKHRLNRIPSAYDARKPRVLLGLELEMECDIREDVAHAITNDLGRFEDDYGIEHDYAFFERDGSLNNGIEMVTAWTGLDVHEQMLKRAFTTVPNGAKSHNTATCGLHVHVCKSTMTTLHASKLILFINDARNRELIKAIARRDNASYAQFKDKKTDFKDWTKPLIRDTKAGHKGIALRGLNRDRYEALNFQNPNTIEFRLFKGSLKLPTIMACLEFSFLAWHFTKDAGVTDLTSASFLRFISRDAWRSDSRYLRAYLKDKGFDVVYKSPTVRAGVNAV